jgi:hypothetical protein
MTKNCPNGGHIGYYEGGFCKKCSARLPADARLYVLAGVTDSAGYTTQIPNPRIRWSKKMFVKDLSHRLSGSERVEFYMTPEQRQKYLDRMDYFEERWDDDIGETKVRGRKPKTDEDEEEVWYE